jgi:hypothetical protein
MQILKTIRFDLFCRDHNISDAKLIQVIQEVNDGLVDARLGAGIIKKRLARDGAGKSGGFRTLIVYKLKHRAVFLYAFPKNTTENIDSKTLENLKLLAKTYNSLSDSEITLAINAGKLIEVQNEGR